MSSADEEHVKVWSLFPLPVKKIACPIILDHVIMHVSNIPHSPSDVGTSYSLSTDILSDTALHDLREWLLEQSRQFAVEQMCVITPIKITQSWTVRLWPSNTSWRIPHHHPNCLLTGILYLEKEPAAGHLRISRQKAVANAIEMVIPKDFTLSANNPWACDSVEIPATVGDLILLPSYALHSVDMKDTKKPRTSLCFDVLHENIWGHDQYPPQQLGSTYFASRETIASGPGDENEQR